MPWQTPAVQTEDGLNSDIGDGVDYLDPRWLARSDALIFNPSVLGGVHTRAFTSGSASVNNNEKRASIETGSTSGSSTTIRAGIGGTNEEFGESWGNDRTWSARVTFDSDVSNRTDYHGTGSAQGGSEGVAFKLSGGDLLGAVHDGTSETTTSLITGVSASSTAKRLRIEYVAGDRAEFFVDGINEGTVSSGLPTGTQEAEYFYTSKVENSDAANKVADIAGAVVVQAP